MSARDELARVLLGALCNSPVWADRHIGELEEHITDTIADAVLSEWLPTLAGDEAVNDMLGRWAIRETHGEGTEFFSDIAAVLRGQGQALNPRWISGAPQSQPACAPCRTGDVTAGDNA